MRLIEHIPIQPEPDPWSDKEKDKARGGRKAPVVNMAEYQKRIATPAVRKFLAGRGWLDLVPSLIGSPKERKELAETVSKALANSDDPDLTKGLSSWNVGTIEQALEDIAQEGHAKRRQTS